MALGHKTIAETFNLSAPEWAFWSEFYRKHGFPADRLEAAVAIAGAAVCQSNGAKTQPKDLAVRFTRRQPGNAELIAAFSAIPGAKVEHRPKRVKQPEGTANG